MSKLYTGSINVNEIDKERLYQGKKGLYLNLAIWVNDEPDQNGNHISVQQQVKKGETRIYLGNAKEFKIDDLPF